MKIFDYYSFGIPVIATDLPTTRELVDEGETGLFFSSDDQDAFSKNIDILYSNAQIYKTMVNKVYEKAETLLWDKRAKMFKDILDAIVC